MSQLKASKKNEHKQEDKAKKTISKWQQTCTGQCVYIEFETAAYDTSKVNDSSCKKDIKKYRKEQ